MSAGANLKVLDWAGYEGAVSFTFDDTQPSQIRHWNEIDAVGVRATWYLSPVYRQNADFETTWSRVLAAGHEIGGHTSHHHRVSELTGAYPSLSISEAAARELDECDTYIRTVIGQSSVWTMAYPYGDLEWGQYLGSRYLFARTTNDGGVSATENLNQMLLPAYTVQAGDTQSVFTSKLEQAADAKSWRSLIFHSLLPTDQNWYAGVQISDVVAALQYGKHGGRVWLDSVVNIGSYWLAARWLRATEPVSQGGQLIWSWKLPTNFPSRRHLRVVVDGGQLSQNGVDLIWNSHGFYEVDLDAGSLVWRPR